MSEKPPGGPVLSSVLVIGSVVTTGLHFAFNNRTYEPVQVMGLGVIVIGVVLWAALTWSAAKRAGVGPGKDVLRGDA